MEQKKELVIFETKDHAVKLEVPVNEETVWLNRQQMAELFDRDVKTIGKHSIMLSLKNMIAKW